MTDDRYERLRHAGLRARRHVVELSARAGCFIGAALSCVDILTVLYFEYLRVDPRNPRDPSRDYFILSKGHAVPALYAVLAERAFFPPERVFHPLTPEGLVYWHPNTALPGVEWKTGSLGHGLPIGVGLALGVRLDGGTNRVVVLMGDGELQEGTVWEAAIVAASRKLDNLLVIVDRNSLQANVRTEELVPLEPLEEKFASFGWAVATVDGHDYRQIVSSLGRVPFRPGAPSAVIARTLRGKGIASLEDRVEKWFVQLTEEEAAEALRELGAGGE